MDNGDQLLSSNIPVGLVTSKGQISRVTGMTKRLSSHWVELEEDRVAREAVWGEAAAGSDCSFSNVVIPGKQIG